jgi:hypothetical protein
LLTYGLVQLVKTLIAQLSGPAHVVDLLAFYAGGAVFVHHPEQLYRPEAVLAVEEQLRWGADGRLQFWNPPLGAVLFAPLTGLPFGVAHLVWVAISLVAFGTACWLIAPRLSGERSWLAWLVTSPLYMPLQFALIMGQPTLLMLLGFAGFVRLSERNRLARAALALLPLTLKPQLLPTYGLVLLTGRRFGALALLALPALLVSGVFFGLTGPATLADYLAQSAAISALGYAGQDGPGAATALAFFQWLVGPGQVALALDVVTIAAVLALLAHMWRGGLHADATRYLQLAVLPLAATLTTLHAMDHELVFWLASGWLLMRYAQATPSARALIAAVCVSGLAAANFSVGLRSVPGVPPLAAMWGLATLSAIGWLACRGVSGRRWTRPGWGAGRRWLLRRWPGPRRGRS